jgi:hypothetical protein
MTRARVPPVPTSMPRKDIAALLAAADRQPSSWSDLLERVR